MLLRQHHQLLLDLLILLGLGDRSDLLGLLLHQHHLLRQRLLDQLILRGDGDP